MNVNVMLPSDVWENVSRALEDYLRFGPGELDSDYIPDEHLEKARTAIISAVTRAEQTAEKQR